jgi:hypothetical protein
MVVCVRFETEQVRTERREGYYQLQRDVPVGTERYV